LSFCAVRAHAREKQQHRRHVQLEAEADRAQQKELLAAGAWDRDDETADRIVRVEIEPISIHGERGQHYRVWHEGSVLIEDTWTPEFETCRALRARGIRGKLQTRRRGKRHWDMQLEIERGAGLTVEGERAARSEDCPLAPSPSVRCSFVCLHERQRPNCSWPVDRTRDRSRGNLTDAALCRPSEIPLFPNDLLCF